MPPTDTPDAPTANTTYVDKRVFCKLHGTNVILMLGLANKDIRVPQRVGKSRCSMRVNAVV